MKPLHMSLSGSRELSCAISYCSPLSSKMISCLDLMMAKPWSNTLPPYFSLMKVLNSGNSQEEILIISSLLTLPATLPYWPSFTIAVFCC